MQTFNRILRRFLLGLIIAFSVALPQAGIVADDFGSGLNSYLPLVHLKDFIQLQAGMKKAEVDELLEHPGHHEFTHLDEKTSAEWLFVYYRVVPKQKHVYIVDRFPAPDLADTSVHLLFKNDVLHAVVDTDDLYEHFREFRKSPENREYLKSLGFLDNFLIEETFLVKSYKGDQIEEMMDAFSQKAKEGIEARRSIERSPQFSLPFTLALTAVMAPRMVGEYKKNKKHLKIFDPQKLAIGTKEEKVKSLFGKPLYREEMEGQIHIGIYGPEKPTAVNPEVACVPILVVYRNDSVMRVISHYFYFNRMWRLKYIPRP